MLRSHSLWVHLRKRYAGKSKDSWRCGRGVAVDHNIRACQDCRGAHSPCLRRRGSKGSKGVVTELLGAGMTLQSELDLFCDVTGSEDLTNLTGRQIVQFLQRQNLDLLPDSLIFVSMNSAGGRSPTACMWMSTRQAILTSVGMATNSRQ